MARHPIVIALLFLAVPACSQTSRPTRLMDSPGHVMVKQGQNALARQDYTLALSLFEQALAANAADPEALAGRGRCQLSKKQFDEAIADFTSAIENKPDLGSAYLYRGLAFAEKEDFGQAARDGAKATELGVTEVNPDQELAAIAARHGVKYEATDLGKAVQCLQIAIRHAPEEPSYRYRLGVIYSGQEDWGNAIKLLQEALKRKASAEKINPVLAVAYLGRARQAKEKNQDRRAKADFDEAVRLEPSFIKHAREFP